MEDYEPYMEPQLMTLLEFLILSKDRVDFGDYIEWVLDKDQDLVSKCITDLWDAQLKDSELKKWRNLFHFLYD